MLYTIIARGSPWVMPSGGNMKILTSPIGPITLVNVTQYQFTLPNIFIKDSLKTSRFLSKHQGFSRNIKVFLETNYINSIPIYIYINCLPSLVSIKIGKCQLKMTILYSNHLTSFVSIQIGKRQPLKDMLYSNCLTYFVSIKIGKRQLEMNMYVFLLSLIYSLLVLFLFY